jgi:chorismate mutase
MSTFIKNLGYVHDMTLEKVRADISRIDTEIIRLIAERQALAEQVASIKEQTGMPVHDTERTAEVLRTVSTQATGYHMDPVPVRNIFETLIAMSEDRQRKLRGKGKTP